MTVSPQEALDTSPPATPVPPEPAKTATHPSDEALFRKLVQDHQHRLYRFVVKHIGWGTDAEDITQQAFVEAAHSYATFKGESELSTWLYRGREDGWIQMQVWRQGAHLHLQLRDGAPGFNPTNPVPPPDLSLSLEQRVPGGLGLMFVRHLSDEIGYRRLSRARPRDPTAGPDLNLGDRTDAQTGINELRLVYHLARPRR